MAFVEPVDDIKEAARELIQIDSGEYALSKDAVVRSEEFATCNLFVLKNTDTGDVLVMHNYLGHPDDTKRHRETNDRYFRLGSIPLVGTKVNGISRNQAPALKEFLETPGNKYAFSAFKNDHGQCEVLRVVGSGNDGGITEFLASKGVKVLRHSIEHFDEAGYNSKDGFHAEYDALEDRLKLSLAVGKWSEHENDFHKHSYEPAQHNGNLLDTPLFDEQRLAHYQGGEQLQRPSGRGR